MLPVSSSEAFLRPDPLELNSVTDATEGATAAPASRDSSRAPSPLPASASTIFSYYHRPRRRESDFDDLYDVSESESTSIQTDTSSRSSMTSADSGYLCDLKRRSPVRPWRPPQQLSLAIPSPQYWPIADAARTDTKNSWARAPKYVPPPIVPPKVPPSPGGYSSLASDGSFLSQLPSLDGGSSSVSVAERSTPPTPVDCQSPPRFKSWVETPCTVAEEPDLQDEESLAILNRTASQEQARLSDGGIHLPPEAFQVLKQMSLEETASSISIEQIPEMEQIRPELVHWTPGAPLVFSCPGIPSVPPSASGSCQSDMSDSLSPLSLPSPRAFFASLDRSTDSIDPMPSSSTAEEFYSTPWQRAIMHDLQLPSPQHAPDSKEVHAAAFDRMTSWVQAQNSLLDTLRRECQAVPIPRHAPSTATEGSLKYTPSKKAVRFLDIAAAQAAAEAARDNLSPPSSTSSDSLFYHAFQTVANNASPTDAHAHRLTRWDAMQALRASRQSLYLDALLGHYETIERERPRMPRPISMMPSTGDTKSSKAMTGTAMTRLERERQALDRVQPAQWIVEATRFLNGGRLLNSPVGHCLRDLSRTQTAVSRPRVLDLGGQPTCDWAWHVAREYPHAKVYTATCDARAMNPAVKGPSGHRTVQVNSLCRLPFPAAHFDVVSARTLQTFLHDIQFDNDNANEGPDDVWEACLRECLRVLRPGGFLEFMVLDAELLNAGRRASAASAEMAFHLTARGYDPNPTRKFLPRLRRAGAVEIRRAWSFLPMGPTPGNSNVGEGSSGLESPASRPSASTTDKTSPHPRGLNSDPDRQLSKPSSAACLSERQDSLPLNQSQVADIKNCNTSANLPVSAAKPSLQPNANQSLNTGHGTDAAAVSGLVGAWFWEQWRLKLQMEMGRPPGLLADDVAGLIDEGRRDGAGWRCLMGWARKPPWSEG